MNCVVSVTKMGHYYFIFYYLIHSLITAMDPGACLHAASHVIAHHHLQKYMVLYNQTHRWGGGGGGDRGRMCTPLLN